MSILETFTRRSTYEDWYAPYLRQLPRGSVTLYRAVTSLEPLLREQACSFSDRDIEKLSEFRSIKIDALYELAATFLLSEESDEVAGHLSFDLLALRLHRGQSKLLDDVTRLRRIIESRASPEVLESVSSYLSAFDWACNCRLPKLQASCIEAEMFAQRTRKVFLAPLLNLKPDTPLTHRMKTEASADWWLLLQGPSFSLDP